MLTPGMEKCIAYVQNLEEKDFKEKVRTNMDNVYIFIHKYAGCQKSISK